MTLQVENDRSLRVSIITFDRPTSKNAATLAMWSHAAHALSEASADGDIASVLIRGADAAFCAGADLTELRDPDKRTGPEDSFAHFIDELSAFPKPVVAAVDGVAVGAGFTLLCYADLVLGSRRARFRAPFVEMGLTADAGSSYMLVERIGWQGAALAFFTGSWLDAQDAHRLGLVSRVVEPDDLEREAFDLVSSIGAMPLGPLVATKRWR